MESYRIVSSEHAAKLPVGKYSYFVHHNYEGHPSGCRVMREVSEVSEALVEGRDVWWVNTACSFCGGPTPCLRDD